MVKSLTAFLQVLVQESGERCDISTIRDQKTISDRVEHEGLSFITIVLPAFGKSLQKALDQGSVTHDHFPGFTQSGGLPRFLGGFLELVFDRGTGVLLDIPSIEAIRCLHQITSLMAKVGLRCSKSREDLAIRKFVECEQEVRKADSLLTESNLALFKQVSRILYAELFTNCDLTVYRGELIPRHGSGATADKLRGNAKYNQSEWTYRLEPMFPAGEFLIPSWRYRLDLDAVRFLEPSEERPVKVTLVPKTLKTPRVIAEEPACMQYAQQSLRSILTEGVEKSNSLSPFIGFRDQIPNRMMAGQGSSDGTLATLDLSEASDRVSNQLVLLLMENHPYLRDATQACRSRKADVPGVGIIRLAKFASMGSALCFPVEAMVFLTIIFVGICQELNVPMTSKLLSQFRGQVRVYGDDIIVPVDMMGSVSRSLEAFGLKVNTDKSFGTGKFRESCGGDYYDGRWITPVRCRSLFPKTLKHVQELISTIALRNLLHQEGWQRPVEWLDEKIRRVYPSIPYVEPSSPVLGLSTWGPVSGTRVDVDTQVPLVKGFVVSAVLPVSKLDGYGALLKFFLPKAKQKTYGWEAKVLPHQEDHLNRAGRPVSVNIKTRWAPVR